MEQYPAEMYDRDLNQDWKVDGLREALSAANSHRENSTAMTELDGRKSYPQHPPPPGGRASHGLAVFLRGACDG